jgi:RNA polymerase-associated protein LEO1
MPSFLAVEPAAFTPQSFTLPETYHHSSAPPPSAAAFSPLAVATTTLRWRYAPDGSGVLQSDARILQWSDGSLTLQLASNAPAQFELAPKPLAPRLYSNKRGPRQQHGGGGRAVEPGAYAEQHDAHTYVTAPHESAHLLRVTNHVTASLSVLPSEQVDDAALTQLRASLAAARERRNNKHHQLAAQTKGQTAGGAGGAGGVGVGGAPNGSVGDGPPIITVTEDPELAKRRAEIAEKERLRQQRRMQMSMARELERSNRTLSKSGLSRTGGSAGAGGMLSVSGLEEDEATDRARRQQRGSGMAAAAAVASARKKQARGRYDDDDDLPRYRSREDEYDRTDDFLAPSDEEDDDFEGDTDDDDDEEEVLGDEDGTDDADDDEEDRAAARKKSRKKDKKKKGKDRAKPREKRLDAKDKGATTPSPPRPPTSPNTNKRERPGDDDNVDGSGRKASQQTDAVQPSSAKDARLKRRRLIVEDDEE